MVAADSILPANRKACRKIVGCAMKISKATETTDIAERMLKTYWGHMTKANTG